MSKNRKDSAQDLLAKYVNFIMDEDSSDDDDRDTTDNDSNDEENYVNDIPNKAREKSEGEENSVKKLDTLELDVNKDKLISKKAKDKNLKEAKVLVPKKAKDYNKKEIAAALVAKNVKGVSKKDAEHAKLARDMSKKEAEASFLKFHKVRRTFKSDGRIINDAPTATEPISRPKRFECEMCAKFFITEDELRNHTKMAKTMRWVCSASGRVAVKRKAPSDDFNEIALPRKKLRQMKKHKKSKYGQ